MIDHYNGFKYQIALGNNSLQITSMYSDFATAIMFSSIPQEFMDQINALEPTGLYGDSLKKVDEIVEKLPRGYKTGAWK